MEVSFGRGGYSDWTEEETLFSTCMGLYNRSELL